MKWILAIFLLAGSALGQAYLPKSCKVGDVSDSYVGHWQMCPATDKWVPYTMGKNIPTSWSGGMENAPYPDCRLAFKDDDNNWHCPYESASGRVVACEPCHINTRYPKECAHWYKECEDLVDIMRHHATSEPTRIDVLTARQDHTPYGIYECPDGFNLHWYTREKSGHLPICIEEK